jgi:hypothetical protein
MRPDKSQGKKIGRGPRPSLVRLHLAGAGRDAAWIKRASRIDVVLARLARELAAARREVGVLKRENAALRTKLEGRDTA